MPLATILLALAAIGIAYAAERWALAVYALSFWYYLVYVLAFFWRQVTLDRFIRDSVLLKTLSLAALASVLWTTLPNPVSIIVMAAGFALSIAATRALGTERTYYGFETRRSGPKTDHVLPLFAHRPSDADRQRARFRRHPPGRHVPLGMVAARPPSRRTQPVDHSDGSLWCREPISRLVMLARRPHPRRSAAARRLLGGLALRSYRGR